MSASATSYAEPVSDLETARAWTATLSGLGALPLHPILFVIAFVVGEFGPLPPTTRYAMLDDNRLRLRRIQ